MTGDNGFAPNPFHGVLTLATCKSAIRRAKTRRVGEWIAGTCSKTLARQKGVSVDVGAIIWIGKLSEPPLPYEDYFVDPRFKSKKPSKTNKKTRCGDNIYKLVGNKIEQDIGNLNPEDNFHPDGLRDHDIGGRNVLIFKEFYYLGSKGFVIPDCIDIKISEAARTKYVDCKTGEIAKLIKYIKGKYGSGQIGEPCTFGDTGCYRVNDNSKKSCGSVRC